MRSPFFRLAVLILCAATPLPAQTPQRDVPLRQAFTATVGGAFPFSRDGIRAFWQPGLSAAGRFTTAVTREVGIGVGVEASQLSFDRGAFEAAYPTVPPETNELLLIAVSVHAKVLLLPSYRTCPYLVAEVGAARLTEATYRRISNGTRTTYYSVGGTTRLQAGISGGVDITFTRWLAFELEGKFTYIHNDPDAGLLGAARGGFRVRF